MLVLRLPPEVERRLDELADRTGRTRNSHARAAIAEYLDDFEDASLAEERHQQDSGKRISLEALMGKYAGDLKANR